MPDPKPTPIPDPVTPNPMTAEYIEGLNISDDVKDRAIDMARNDNYPKPGPARTHE